MAYLVLPNRFYPDSEIPEDVNWRNPITQDLLYLIVPGSNAPNTARNLVSKVSIKSTTANANQALIAKNGIKTAWQSGASALNTVFNTRSSFVLGASARYTVIAYGGFNTASAGYSLYAPWNNGLFFIDSNGFGGFGYNVSNTYTPFTSCPFPAGTSSPDVPALVSYRFDGASVKLGVNSESRSTTFSGLVSLSNSSFDVRNQENAPATGARNWVTHFAAWRRCLSNGELLALQNDPWQLFAPSQPRIFSFTAAGGNAYTLNGSAGSFTLTGQQASVRAGRRASANVGSYALTGQQASVRAGRKASANVGSFTLTGQSAAARAARNAAASAGSFTLTGQQASVRAGRRASADAGNFTLTGQSASIRAGRRASANAGSFTLTGQTASLKATRFLVSSPGSYSLTGQNASLTYGRRFTAGPGSYSVVGQDASAAVSRKLTASTGTYTLTGQLASLRAARNMTLSTGAYSVTGQLATLTLRRYLTVSAGSFTANGQSASLKRALNLGVQAGTFLVAGQQATLTAGTGKTLTAQAGSFSLTGNPVTFLYGRKLYVQAGTFSVAGQTATLKATHNLVAQAGVYAVTGQSASVRAGYRATASAASFTLTGRDAIERVGRRAIANVGTFTLTGQAAQVSPGKRLNVQAGAYTYTGYSATASTGGRKMYLGAGSFAVSGQRAALNYSGAPVVVNFAPIGGPGIYVQYLSLAPTPPPPFSPASLFAAGEPGTWYDPSDLTTLFEDSVGTTPITSVLERPVGLMLDQSKGLVLGSELVANGDFASGTTTGWIPTSATFAVVSGEAELTSTVNGTFQTNYQIATTVGRTYKLTATIRRGTCPQPAYFGFNGVNSASTNSTTNTTLTLYLTSNSASINVQVYSTGASIGNTLYVDNISVRELPGNHAYQTSNPSRPTLSARYNLLTKTEQFNDAAWQTTAAPTLTAGITNPLGGTTAFNMSGASKNIYQQVVGLAAGSNVVFGLWVKAATSGTISIGSANSPGSRTFVNVTTTWTRVSYAFASSGASDGPVMLTNGTLSSVDIWGADFRLANDGVGIPAYQRVNTSTDYDTTGFPPYLAFNGTNSWMQTATITPGTDKAQVFAGVRKLSDAAGGMALEFSPAYNSNNGSFGVLAPLGGTGGAYYAVSKGTLPGDVSSAAYSAPDSKVITLAGDISGDSAILRVNGAQVASNTTDQGTGNFLAYPLYIGRRGGTSLPYSGRIYSLITRFGPNLTGSQISSTETWVNTKTKAY